MYRPEGFYTTQPCQVLGGGGGGEGGGGLQHVFSSVPKTAGEVLAGDQCTSTSI